MGGDGGEEEVETAGRAAAEKSQTERTVGER
jgi:hypothetical protein